MDEPLLHGVAQTERDRAEPLLRAGNTNCGGCGMSVALQLLSRAAADHELQMVIPACCAAVTAGPFPYSGYGAPVVATTFASAAAVASGLAQVATMNGEATRVVCFAGDGGTYDIGLATLSATAERGEDVLYICYDNEIYGNTGGQRSGGTPLGAVTTTTPRGKPVHKKDILGIMAAHRVPYAATISLGHADDALRKLRHALGERGFRFVHLLAPCPTGWKSEPSAGVELVRAAVASGLYPVYEIFEGERLVFNVEPPHSDVALQAWLDGQGRFKPSVYDLAELRREIERTWRGLRRLARG